MSRFQDIALGAGVLVCLAALTACAVQMVVEVLAVERNRRKDVGGGQSAGARPDAIPAPSPDAARWGQTDVMMDRPAPVMGATSMPVSMAPLDAAARVVAELEGRS